MLADVDKKEVIEALVRALQAELDGVRAAARSAREGATHEEAKPENQYDTRALEASYLAGAQSARADVLDAAIQTLSRLDLRSYDDETPIGLAALVELEHDGNLERYFVAPEGGGVKVPHEGGLIRIVTTASPIGRAIAKKRVGDSFHITIKRERREYDIVDVA